jgi:hypothetical protein
MSFETLVGTGVGREFMEHEAASQRLPGMSWAHLILLRKLIRGLVSISSMCIVHLMIGVMFDD